MRNITEILKHYMIAALWTSHDESTPEGGEPMDRNYDINDIVPESMKIMKSDVKKFVTENKSILNKSKLSDEQIGHDFWLTRNHHGAGFFDRNLPDDIEKKLIASAHAMGESSLYVGDDKKIYVENSHPSILHTK